MTRSELLLLKLLPAGAALIVVVVCLALIARLCTRKPENAEDRKWIKSHLGNISFVGLIAAIAGCLYWARVIEPFLNSIR